MGDVAVEVRKGAQRGALAERLEETRESCTGCGACREQCAFLTQHGAPGRLAAGYDPEDRHQLKLPFGCSLCSLCTSVCPAGLDPCQLFLEMRRESVRRGAGNFRRHRVLRNYERRGTSKRYTYYALPAGCTSVFFPGCALSGTRSGQVLEVFELLRCQDPSLGVVLDCCSKPSHDLGDEERFAAMFGEMRDYLLSQGVRRILVACPSCHSVFERYGDGLDPESVYEILSRAPIAAGAAEAARVTVHDPCVVRFDPQVQRASRRLLEQVGLAIEEMTNSGRRTLCCGEGGAVSHVDRGLVRAWKQSRVEQAEGRPIATYCAGCAHQLGRHLPVHHVLDLVLHGRKALAGKARVARAPFTYWHRLRLKRRLRRMVDAAETRERIFRF